MTAFTYKGTEFRLMFHEVHGRRRVGPVATLHGLEAHLPSAFRRGLSHYRAVLHSDTRPTTPLLRPGCYIGSNYGIQRATCWLDPNGEVHKGKPTFTCKGRDYNDVISLFRRAIAGELTPGYQEYIWSATIYRVAS